LNSAVRALPRCSSPVGLGAKRAVAGTPDALVCASVAAPVAGTWGELAEGLTVDPLMKNKALRSRVTG
jgi:hypothetical protein